MSNRVTDTTKRLREGDPDDCAVSGKRSRISSEPTTEDDGEDWRPPCKVQETKGCVAARDYEVVVRQILKRATGFFRARLVAKNIYPDHMTAILWAQEAWTEACTHVEAKVRYNDEIIQLVSQ